MADAEIWRQTEGFPDYSISNLGRVKRVTGGRGARVGHILKPGWTGAGRGHLSVFLRRDGRYWNAPIHRLLAIAFIPNPMGLPFVLHWDDDPSNNSLSNLRWGTHQQNMRDVVRNGNHEKANRTHCIRGHEYTEENTVRTRADGGARVCRACRVADQREIRKVMKARGIGPEDPRHGSHNGYTTYGCRCDLCLQAESEYRVFLKNNRMRRRKVVA